MILVMTILKKKIIVIKCTHTGTNVYTYADTEYVTNQCKLLVLDALSNRWGYRITDAPVHCFSYPVIYKVNNNDILPSNNKW